MRGAILMEQEAGRIVLPPAIREAMLAHARSRYPEEVCGMLSGWDGRVQRIHRIDNVDCSRTTYRMDPGGQFRIMRAIESSGELLLGIYHSHPDSPALPSSTDVERAFFPGTREPSFPRVAYVIVGLVERAPEFRAFLIGPKAVKEIGIGGDSGERQVGNHTGNRKRQGVPA